MSRNTRWPLGTCVLALLALLDFTRSSRVSAETLRWTRSFNGAANGDDACRGVAVGPDGRVYVTGYTAVAGQGLDLLLQKYSPAGVPVWTRTYNGAGNNTDAGLGVAAGADGTLYVAGSTYVPGQGKNMLLQRYASLSGLRSWSRTFDGVDNRDDEARGVAVGRDGSVYVTGDVTVLMSFDLLLRKYSPSGLLRWSRSQALGDAGRAGGVAVSPEGNIVVSGSFDEVHAMESFVLLQKYSPTGVSRWKKSYTGCPWGDYCSYATAVAVGADRSIYLTGVERDLWEGEGVLIQRYSPTGTLQWTRVFNGTGDGYDIGRGVAVGRDGSVYVTGHVTVTPGLRDTDLLLQKYSPTGELAWTKTLDGGGHGQDDGKAVAVGPDGSVYVCGFTSVEGQGQNLILQKYK